MEVSKTTQTYQVEQNNTINKTQKAFENELSSNTDQYSEYEQYIKNYSRILEASYGYTKKEAIERTKEYINNTEVSPPFFPIGSNLTDEFTNSFLQTYEDLSKEDRQHLELHMTIKAYSEFEFDKDGNLNKTNNTIYNSNENIKKEFEERIYNLTNVDSNQDEILISIYEKLLNNFDKNIKNKEEENQALLQEATKNTKPNPLENMQQNKTNEKPKFIDTLDKLNPNAFKDMGISKEDEKLFRQIIDDGEISEKELRNLSYEQTSQLNKFYNENMSYVIDEVGLENTPILLPSGHNSFALLNSSTFIPNERFNQALHKTIIEDTKQGKYELSEMISQLQSNLLQVHLGERLQADFLTGSTSNGIKNPYFVEKENFDINYGTFISELTSYYNKQVLKDHKFDDIKENYMQRADWFSLLEQNYKNITDI
ncbi:MAG: hypothetical protein U9Q33_10370 [Campylobacterota bacterium]|nr:hypothetical protein [Campylobacterota bacterium]